MERRSLHRGPTYPPEGTEEEPQDRPEDRLPEVACHETDLPGRQQDTEGDEIPEEIGIESKGCESPFHETTQPECEDGYPEPRLRQARQSPLLFPGVRRNYPPNMKLSSLSFVGRAPIAP